MVTIVEPDPRWPGDFDRIAAEIRAAVGEHLDRVDHIGSTAVPGLVAKDVIDVQITVSRWDAVGTTLDLLAHDGWTVHRDIGRDHAVPGLPDDPDLWTKGFASDRPGERATHVHVRVAGRPNQRYALLFPDYLRAHSDAAAAYGELNRRLAPLAPDSATYADTKDPACDLIYVAAEAWASEVAWDPG
jgi:GrpB-like predicted nucleotidyltransferase (UPF0157 family)